MDFIPTKKKNYKPKGTKIPVQDGLEKDKQMNKETYKATKALHKQSIKQSKQDIRKYKLLIKQAQLNYKLSVS